MADVRKSSTNFLVLFLASVYLPPTAAVNRRHVDLREALDFISSQSPESSVRDFQYLKDVNQIEDLPEFYVNGLLSLSEIATSRERFFTKSEYRRFDGVGNNLAHPFWGAFLHVQRRVLPNAYDNDVDIPRINSARNSSLLLPSARAVSLNCFLPGTESDQNQRDRESSQLVWQFGQFLDHDMTLTEGPEGVSGCCENMYADGTHPDMFTGGNCCPIPISADDRYYDTDCMEFVRSVCVYVNGVREQVNGITAFLDASNVYGPNERHCEELREFSGGLLKISDSGMLPNLDQFACTKTKLLQKCPHAGDPRVNEFPGLTSMHTVFHREHNRIATELSKINTHWSDETLFQEARKILIAQYQNIIYHEFLPKLLGPTIMNITGIDAPYEYDGTLDPSISNEFAAAAYRYGHSQVNEILRTASTSDGDLLISDTFFRPDLAVSLGERNLMMLVQNQARYFANKVDHFFTTQLTDKLFEDFAGVDGPFDLPARTIQRGREHGLKSYLRYLDLAVTQLGQLAGVSQMTIPACLQAGIYKTIEDVDLFLGGVCETSVPDGLVGHTFANIIADQFRRLKFGDRFFYETKNQRIGFTRKQLESIKDTSLSGILCQNLPKLKKIQPWAFFSRRPEWNRKVLCEKIPVIDLELWREDKFAG